MSRRMFVRVTVTEGGADFDYGEDDVDRIGIDVNEWWPRENEVRVREMLRKSKIGDIVNLDGCATCFVMTEDETCLK